MEIITNMLENQAIFYAFSGVFAGIIGFIFKKIPNEKIKNVVGKAAYSAGVAVSLGLTKWKLTAKFWNKTIEPFFIDLIDNTIIHGLNEFIRGLRSD